MKNIIDLICVIVNNAQAHGVWGSLRKTRKLCIFFTLCSGNYVEVRDVPLACAEAPYIKYPGMCWVLSPHLNETSPIQTPKQPLLTKPVGLQKTVVLTNQIHLAWKYYLLLFWIYYIFKTILTTPIGEMLSMSLLIVV